MNIGTASGTYEALEDTPQHEIAAYLWSIDLQLKELIEHFKGKD